MKLKLIIGAAVAATTLAGTGMAAYGASDAAAAATTVRVMTWNVCGNTVNPPANECTNSRSTVDVVKGIWWHLNVNNMLKVSDHPDGAVHVVMLQEICYQDKKRMDGLPSLDNWTFGFVSIKSNGANRECHADKKTGKARGAFGVVIGIDRRSGTTFSRYHYNYYPHGDNGYGYDNVQQGLICLNTPSIELTACGTHLTPTPSAARLPQTGHDEAYFRNIQLHQAEGIPWRVGTEGRIIAGGDLNVAPPDGAGADIEPSNPIVPLYDAYHECSEDEYGKRDGHGTYQYPNGGIVRLDYVFASKSATSSCTTTDEHVALSDHRPVIATVQFPAT